MQRIVHDTARLPLHDVAATRTIEQRALAGVPPGTLVERAGLDVARLALALAPHAQRVWVAAGPGHNGADGLEAAARLSAAGRQVQVSLLADRQRLPRDAQDALARALAAGVVVEAGLPAQGSELAIDALLGIGATRAPQGAMAAAVDCFNRMPGQRLAVDLPSGLDADSGRVLGAPTVQATHTLTMLTLKPGLFTASGRDLAGEVWLDTLDESFGDPPQAWLTGRADLQPLLARRRHAQHKGSFGDLIVVGGAAGMVGAAWLAARAALSAGAGRVYVSLLDDSAPAFDPTRPELMSRHALWQAPPAQLAASTVVCGCGGGDAVRSALPSLLSNAGRLLLDADALNAISADPGLRALLAARGRRGLPTVLTPHPLEAARLLSSDARAVQSDRRAAAQALADEFNAVVLLKGSGTVIAGPGLPPFINPTGNAALATAGTGDVLAGWIGGWLAALDIGRRAPGTAPAPRGSTQPPSGRPGDSGATAAASTLHALQQTVAAAAWLHGAAADAEGLPGPLRAADLIEAMGRQARAAAA
jgi:ADP-dependent NAD(P)H-hydrate dehydratase / NAD(P)H-hydrate epimerase